MRRRLLISLILVAATIAVYAQVRDHAFVNYDDYAILAAIDDGINAESVRRTFTDHIVSNWIPFTWLTLIVEYQFFGREPAGYHLTSVALHAANAVVLFWLLHALTGAIGRSAFVAAVFALHPLHVESVAWFAERKDVLSGLFFLLTLCAYVRYTNAPASSRQRTLLYGCVLLSLAIGLVAKPMLVTLPFVLLLLDYWPLSRVGNAGSNARIGWGDAVREKIPLFALVVAASVGAIVTQDWAGSLSDTTVLTLPRRAANAIDSYWIYIGKSLWPTDLAAFYPHPIEAASAIKSLGLGLGLVVMTAAAFAIRARYPYTLVGWLWYVGMLVPVIGLVQVGSQARADRYTYLPQIGLAIVFAWGANDLLAPRRWGRAVMGSCAGIILAALAVTSWNQVGHWKDSIALHTRSAAVTQNNFRAHNGLAAALRRAGRLEEAELQYQHATALAPRVARPWIGHAEVLAALGREDEAIEAYRAGIRIAPGHIRAHINLGLALLRIDRIDEAIVHFDRAFALDDNGLLAARGSVPFLISLHRGMGLALAARGRLAASGLKAEADQNNDNEGAIEQFEALLAIRPGDASAHIALAEVLLRSGRIDEGRSHLARGRELGSQP